MATNNNDVATTNQHNIIKDEELQVLESIYGEDFIRLDDNQKGALANFELIIRPSLATSSSNVGNNYRTIENHKSIENIKFTVTYTKRYPKAPPKISLSSETVEEKSLQILQEQIEQEALMKSELGIAYVFDLATTIQSFLLERRRKGKELGLGNLYETFQKNEKLRKEQLEKKQLLEEGDENNSIPLKKKSNVIVDEELIENTIRKRDEAFQQRAISAESKNENKKTSTIATGDHHQQQQLLLLPPPTVDFKEIFSKSKKKSRYRADFEELEVLGKGGGGEVVRCRNLLDGLDYAVKRVILGSDDNHNRRLVKEVSNLAKLFHPHIIRYISSWIEQADDDEEEEDDDEEDEDEEDDDNEDDDEEIEEDDDKNNQFGRNGEANSEDFNALLSYHPSDDEGIDDNDDVDVEKDGSTVSSSSSHGRHKEYLQNNTSSENERLFTKSPRASSSHHYLEHDDEEDLANMHHFNQVTTTIVPIVSKLPLGDGNTKKKTLINQSASASSLASSSKASQKEPKRYLFIQMEYAAGQTLREVIDSGELYNNPELSFKLLRQIVEALSYLHDSTKLIHRDLKPGNVFLDSDKNVKLGDFGLATQNINEGLINTSNYSQELSSTSLAAISEDGSFMDGRKQDIGKTIKGKGVEITRGVGTTLYRAPEVTMSISGTFSYNQSADMFSLGVTFYEMMVPPMKTGMERYQALMKLRDPISKRAMLQPPLNPNAIPILVELLQEDPSKRPSATSLLRSGRLPGRLETEAEYFNELVGVVTAPSSSLYGRLISSLFEQATRPELFLTFDHDASSTFRGEAKNLLLQKKIPPKQLQLMSTGFLLPESSSSFSLIKLQMASFVEKIATNEFSLRGAVEFCTPLLIPRAPHELDGNKGGETGHHSHATHPSNAVLFLDELGMVVHLPVSLTQSFARYLALHPDLLFCRRYEIARVYNKSDAAGGQPKSRRQVGYDIVMPQQHFGSDNLFIPSFAETVFLAWNILSQCLNPSSSLFATKGNSGFQMTSSASSSSSSSSSAAAHTGANFGSSNDITEKMNQKRSMVSHQQLIVELGNSQLQDLILRMIGVAKKERSKISNNLFQILQQFASSKSSSTSSTTWWTDIRMQILANSFDGKGLNSKQTDCLRGLFKISIDFAKGNKPLPVIDPETGKPIVSVESTKSGIERFLDELEREMTNFGFISTNSLGKAEMTEELLNELRKRATVQVREIKILINQIAGLMNLDYLRFALWQSPPNDFDHLFFRVVGIIRRKAAASTVSAPYQIESIVGVEGGSATKLLEINVLQNPPVGAHHSTNGLFASGEAGKRSLISLRVNVDRIVRLISLSMSISQSPSGMGNATPGGGPSLISTTFFHSPPSLVKVLVCGPSDEAKFPSSSRCLIAEKFISKNISAIWEHPILTSDALLSFAKIRAIPIVVSFSSEQQKKSQDRGNICYYRVRATGNLSDSTSVADRKVDEVDLISYVQKLLTNY